MTKKKTKCYPEIAHQECKGCERCVASCPKKVLYMGTELNQLGFPSVIYKGSGCIGCGACFYNCPEPGAITIIEETEDSKDNHNEK